MSPKGAFRLGVYETPVKYVLVLGSYTQDTSLFIYKDFKNMNRSSNSEIFLLSSLWDKRYSICSMI